MTWKLSRVHVNMGFISTLDAKRQHTVWGSFRLVAVSVLAYGQLSIIIPACVPGYTVKASDRKGFGR